MSNRKFEFVEGLILDQYGDAVNYIDDPKEDMSIFGNHKNELAVSKKQYI